MAAQIIIFMDSTGTVRAEAPGRNGHRQKLEIDSDAFILRNPTLVAELQTQLAAETAARPLPSAADQARARDAEKLAAREEAKRLEIARFNTWYANLTTSDREAFDRKREASLAKQREQEEARARGVWEMTAVSHGVQLANRIISDPTRRPKRAKAINTAVGNRHYDPKNVIPISLAGIKL